LGVELKGVEDERATEEVVPDHHSSLAQPSLGNEGVGGPQVSGSDLMGGDAWGDGSDHGRERSRSVLSCPWASRSVSGSRERSDHAMHNPEVLAIHR